MIGWWAHWGRCSARQFQHAVSSQDNGNGKLVLPQLNRLHEAFTPVSGHRADFTATGMRSQRNQSDPFRFNHSALYQSLKSKGGLAAAKAAALRINLNVEGCCIVAAPVHAPSQLVSRAPLLLPLPLSPNLALSPAFTSS